MLNGLAVLVQGCWVGLSRLRYSRQVAVVRDYLLLQFDKARVVQRQQLERLKVGGRGRKVAGKVGHL